MILTVVLQKPENDLVVKLKTPTRLSNVHSNPIQMAAPSY